MKYVEVVTESRVRTISLVLLLVFMSLGWYLNSSFWYEAVIMVVSVAFILHSLHYYLTGGNKTVATMAIVASSAFGLFNLLRTFL
ncbi:MULTISPECIES: hypothetical protein [Priestia]|uniref:hypothetical protein n=1 Tax=Priestia TaxID=2800373 RepID=UPI0012A87854|nr:hypothetical protein [Priestia megaterium]QFY76005.1 hypothetical protein CEQ83_26025 [Priestia megaterium]UPK52779.1 hypothetical protein MT476_26845 [Bacillus sp. H8-1]WDC91175.1 hypothetical protein PSR56_27680 [Priestia megaterium]